MGVVYHANYLVWFEIGRTKYIEYLGFKYADMERHNFVCRVSDAHISFKRPVGYGEQVGIERWIRSDDGIRTGYGYQVIGADSNIAVRGTTEQVIVYKDSFRPLSLRKAF